MGCLTGRKKRFDAPDLVGHDGGFPDVVGNEHCGDALFLADLEDELLYLGSGRAPRGCPKAGAGERTGGLWLKQLFVSAPRTGWPGRRQRILPGPPGLKGAWPCPGHCRS